MSNGQTPGKLPKVPRWMVYLLIIGVVASWIPLAMIVRTRAVKSPRERIHIFQDMDIQPRYGAQSPHDLYADGRAMRKPVEGTVAQGELRTDDHYHRGYETDGNLETVMVTRTSNGNETEVPKYYDSFPDEVEVDQAFLERGRERYGIYCGVCHGEAGYGDGPVQRRVDLLTEASAMDKEWDPVEGWAPVRNLHEARIREQPLGQLYDTITRGMGKMPGYATQMPPEDRWAIVAYVRALQLSQHFPADELPDDLSSELQ